MILKRKINHLEENNNQSIEDKNIVEDDNHPDFVNKKSKNVSEENQEFLKSVQLNLEELSSQIKDDLNQEEFRSICKQFTFQFNNLKDNNVEFHQLKILDSEFFEWIKVIVISLTELTTETNAEFFNFLTALLNVAPTIFEPLSDKIFPIAFFYPKRKKKFNETIDSYKIFMNQVLITFEKLKRIPKIISKILACVRNHPNKKWLSEDFFDCAKDNFGKIVSFLPYGQMVELWNALQFNLNTEFVAKRLVSKDNETAFLNIFFKILESIYSEFLQNVKIADPLVSEIIMIKVSDLMKNLYEEFFLKIGPFLQKESFDVVHSFLKLGYNWAELNILLLSYNEKYKTLSSIHPSQLNLSPTDLSYLHSYLSTESWINLGTRLEEEANETFTLFVIMVAQKLKWLAATASASDGKGIKQEEEDDDDDEVGEPQAAAIEREKEGLSQTAKYILKNYHFISQEKNAAEIIAVCSENVDAIDKINLVQSILKNDILINSSLMSQLADYLKNLKELECAFVIETTIEMIRKWGKIKSNKKFTKEIINDVLPIEKRMVVIEVLSGNEDEIDKSKEKDLKNILNQLLDSVNNFINLKKNDSLMEVEDEEVTFDHNLIIPYIEYLQHFSLENFPKHVKSILCLCFTSIIIGTGLNENSIFIEKIIDLLIKCGSNSFGNEIIFSINWLKLYEWVLHNIDSNSSNQENSIHHHKLLIYILENIYVSSKSANEFESNIENLSSNLKGFKDKQTSTALTTFEFLIEDLKKRNSTKELKFKNSKMLPVLEDHCKRLFKSMIKMLKKSTRNSGGGDPKSYMDNENCYRACLLSRKALEVLSEILDNHPTLKLAFSFAINSALNLLNLEHSPSREEDVQLQLVDRSLITAKKKFALKFLHSICLHPSFKEDFKSELPNDFIFQFWTICTRISLQHEKEVASKENDAFANILPPLRELFTVASIDDLDKIGNSIISQMMPQSKSGDDDDEIKMGVMLRALDELLEATMIIEKKQIRQKVFEEFLHVSLRSSIYWKGTAISLERFVFPLLQIQIKLLQRKNTMGIQSGHWAICLSSITSIPLREIKNIEYFRKAFILTAEVLNSITIHRTDIISFRMHIYLQCFQFLLESLASRADQSNCLTDKEIDDLRFCSYTIEKICSSAKMAKKEFSRVSPYFLAIVMKVLETYAIYPSVKGSILNGSYKLLDLCDEYGISQLNLMLNAGTREVFKTNYELYKKFYRYKGKV